MLLTKLVLEKIGNVFCVNNLPVCWQLKSGVNYPFLIKLVSTTLKEKGPQFAKITKNSKTNGDSGEGQTASKIPNSVISKAIYM